MVDIVPVPDPITGGAGAPVMVANIVNAMWNNAQAKYLDAKTEINAAKLLSDPAPQMNAPALDMSYVPPLPPNLIPQDPNEIMGFYESEQAALYAMITSNFSSFINQYFPHPEYFDNAYAWCNNAIMNGGSGISTVQENALWQRDRARVLSDSARAEDEATYQWASKRWSRPPGALDNQISEIRLDANRKLAESSRTTAIKQFDAELENVRFAVKEVIDQRQVALNAAGDYIKTLMLGPQTAMQLATGVAGLRTAFANSLTALYTAEVKALEPRIQLQITDAQLKLQAAQTNVQSLINSIEQKVKAALMAAQTAAQMASAGINGVNAQSSVSGQDVSNL